MKTFLFNLFIFFFYKFSLIEAGSICISFQEIFPCFCTNYEDNSTVILCPGISDSLQLEKVTKSFKSLLIDRLVLLNIFLNEIQVEKRQVKPDQKIKLPTQGMFPKRWLSELRVRNVEIQHAKLNGYFLVEDGLEGQGDFLTSLIVKHANLSGRLCSGCLPASGTISTATKELRRAPLLKLVDFSYNNIDLAESASFPPLKLLTRLILSNNKIARVQENAFSNLPQLQHVDLSKNLLNFISRKVFIMADSKLQTIDISYNSIVSLPADLFQGMNNLREVKLNNNLLETLPSSTWSKIPPSVERIDLTGNFLVCNCSMSWISRTNLDINVELEAYCIFPEIVEFQELTPSLVSFTNCNSRL